MGKWNSWEDDFLNLIFLNSAGSTVIGGGGGITGSGTAGSVYIALFTADPGETGSITNECSYTGYTRVAVARSAAGWTVSSGVCTNDAAITFGTDTVGTETASHFGICKAGTPGVADLIMYGEFTGGGLVIDVGVTPQIQASDLSITED